MPLFVRIGLATGIPFGLLMAFLGGGADSFSGFAVRALALGVPFGVVMAGTLGFAHRRATRHDPPGSPNGATGAAELALPVDDAFALAARAGRALPKSHAATVDEGERTVRLRVGVSWKSWGENVLLRVAGDAHASTVDVSSASRMRSTLVDYGKNQDNVRRVVEWLQAEAGRAAAELHR